MIDFIKGIPKYLIYGLFNIAITAAVIFIITFLYFFAVYNLFSMSDNVGLLVVPIFEFVVIIVIGLIASLIEVNIISNLYQISQLKKVGAAVGYILSFIIPAILLIPFSFVVAFIIV